jgi:hypothetical protein
VRRLLWSTARCFTRVHASFDPEQRAWQ